MEGRDQIDSVRVEDVCAFGALEREWTDLVESTRNVSPFMSWPLVNTWVQVYGRYYSIRVVVLRKAGETVAILPLMIKNCKSRFGVNYKEVRFLCEDHEVSFDYLSFLVADKYRERVLSSITEQIRQIDYDTLRLKNFLKGAVLTDGEPFGLKKINDSLMADLPKTWDSYFSSRPKNFRQNIRTCQNRAKRDYRVKYLRCGTDLGLEKGFAKLKELNLLRWGFKGDAFKTEGYIEFHRTLMNTLFKTGQLFLRFLSFNDNLIAANYSVLYHNRLYVIQMGRDPSLDWYGVGHLLLVELVREAIGAGIDSIDFLATDSEYKRRWCNRTVDLYEANAYRGLKGAAIRFEGVAARLYRGLVKCLNRQEVAFW